MVSSLLCGKTCQYAVRIVFLIFIVVVTSYFFWANNKEGFEEQKAAATKTATTTATTTAAPTRTGADTKKMIEEIFLDLYRREPTTKELQFYTEYASDKPNITKGQLTDVIESTNPDIAKTLEKDSQKVILSSNDPEQVVIEAYSEILFRMPSPSELKKYSDMLKTDAKFNKDRLVFILMSTDEYLRMEKTQTNSVYSSLPGGVTDRQVTMIIERIYSEVSGRTYVDPESMKFFKKKFLEMNLDEVKFKLFLERYVMWTVDDPMQKAVTTPVNPLAGANSSGGLKAAGAATGAGVAGSKTAPSSTGATAGSSTKDAEEDFGEEEDGADAAGDCEVPGTYYKNSTIYNIYTVGNTDYMGMPNSGLIKSLASQTGSCSTGKVVKNISCQKGLISPSDENMKKTTELSSFMDERNRDELRSTCARNRKFGAIDEDDQYAAMFYTNTFTSEDMVLDPSLRWSVPLLQPPVCTAGAKCGVNPLSEQTALIGTPLDQAADTKWGSILPSLPPS